MNTLKAVRESRGVKQKSVAEHLRISANVQPLREQAGEDEYRASKGSLLIPAL